ncbi:MAG: hypothetical protein RL325_1089 [Planctomycetota bacterium]
MSAGSGADVGAVKDGVVGVGIIGLGFMGRTHLAAYAAAEASGAGCAVRAAFDPRQSTAGAGNLVAAGGADDLIDRVPRERSVESLLARRDIGLVSVCTPTDTHIDLVRAAIRARKHVLVEKPTALDAGAIDSLAREAREAGVLVMPAHCMRFWPAWAWMARAVRSRRFGAARRAVFRRVGARPAWSQDFYLDIARSGGAAIDLHIHDADFVRFAFGEPARVAARGSRMHLSAQYGYDDGLEVEAEGGWMDDPAFAFTMAATIECEHGTIDFLLGRDPELLLRRGAAIESVRAGADYALGTGYDFEVRALVDAIRSAAPSAPVTLDDAAATQRLLDRECAQLSA